MIKLISISQVLNIGCAAQREAKILGACEPRFRIQRIARPTYDGCHVFLHIYVNSQRKCRCTRATRAQLRVSKRVFKVTGPWRNIPWQDRVRVSHRIIDMFGSSTGIPYKGLPMIGVVVKLIGVSSFLVKVQSFLYYYVRSRPHRRRWVMLGLDALSVLDTGWRLLVCESIVQSEREMIRPAPRHDCDTTAISNKSVVRRQSMTPPGIWDILSAARS